MANIVGDKSTAKTALATEAMINFIKKHPDGVAAYREIEAAFDLEYAEAMGLPIEKIDMAIDEPPMLTVEDFIRDFGAFLDARIKDKQFGIYVVDSLDALSDEAEMDADVGKGTYGMAKPKMLSTFFRKTTRKIEQSKVLLLIISQVRDNIGAMFGEKHRRAGGKAMDFYASQVLWLSHMGFLTRTIKKVERPYGAKIRGKIKKNKVGLPFREADFNFIFGYGVEDLGASVAWLEKVGRLDQAGLDKKYLSEIDSLSTEDYRRDLKEVSTVVKKAWAEIETSFLPKRSKYR